MPPPKLKLVHVRVPSGEGYELPFPADATPEHILAQLSRPEVKRRFGFAASAPRRDTTFVKDEESAPVVPGPDPSSGFAFDHPDCVVAVGVDDGRGGFVEHARIKGPRPADGGEKDAPAG